jgi:hypothetical protein
MSASFEVSAVARSADSLISLRYFLGLTPPALCCRPRRGLISASLGSMLFRSLVLCLPPLLPTWYVTRRRAPDFEDLNQQQPRDEPADVRRIRDAAPLRTAAKHPESAN